MADIKVEMNPDDVNRAVADAIVKSVLGEQIVKSVQRHLDELAHSSWNNPIDQVVNQVIRDRIVVLIGEQSERVAEAVRKKLSEGIVEKLVETAMEKLLGERLR